MSSSAVGELSIKLTFNNKDYDKSLKNAENSTKSFAQIAKEAIIGNIAVKAFDACTSAVSGFVKSIPAIGKAFDSSMSNVAAISGAAGDELLALRDKAKEMGAATKYTASEAADAMSYMAMAGWKTEQMMDGVAGIMNLAAASGADLAEASDIVTDALTAFGQAAGESGRLADIMAAASANSNTNVHLLGETFKYVAPVAGSLGYAMEDTAVAIGLMANAGIKGSQAGTALRTLLTNLVKPTKAMAITMDELGISVTDTNGEMKPMNQLVTELRQKFSGLSEAEQAAAAATIAGKEGMSGLLAIVNASDSDFNNLTAAINGSAGAAEKMAYTMIDNLAGAQQMVTSKAESLKLTLYEGVEPAMTAITKASGAVISALMGAEGGFELLGVASDEVADKVVQMTRNVPLMVSQMASRIPEIASKILPAISGALNNIVRTIIEIIPMITDAIIKSLPMLIELGIDLITNIITGIANTIPILVEQVVGIIPQIVNVLLNSIPILINAGVQLFLALVSAIPIIVQQLGMALPQIIQCIIVTLIDNLPLILDAAIQLLMALVQAIPIIIQSLMEALPTIIDSIVNFLIDNLPMILDGAIQMFMALIEALPTIIKALVGALPTIIDSVVKFLTQSDTINMILDAAITLFFTLIDSLPTIIDALVSALPDVITSIVEFLTNPATIVMLINAAVKLFFALVQAVPKILGALIGAFGTLVGGLWEAIKAMFGKFAENFGSFVSGAFKGAINGILGFIEGFINSPIKLLNGFIDVINGAFGWVGVNLGKIQLISLPRMEYGGVVPGNDYSGDHNLIRANSGEMVITRSQQAALWEMIETGNYGYDDEGSVTNSVDNSSIEINNNYQINSTLDAEEVGDLVLESIRRAVI